jgi:MIP family channel proteins
MAMGQEHLAVNAVFGLVVAAMIYGLGHISGAHFNPAVTVGFAVARRFPWRLVPEYIGAQVAGAVLASTLHRFLLKPSRFGATIPTVGPMQTIGFEAIGTFFLMLVVISVATDKRVNGAVPGIAIGATVALSGLFMGPFTGNSLNPARSLGPAIYETAALPHFWLYLLGPILGAVCAAVFYEFIRGGAEHGVTNDLFTANERAEQLP